MIYNALLIFGQCCEKSKVVKSGAVQISGHRRESKDTYFLSIDLVILTIIRSLDRFSLDTSWYFVRNILSV